MLITVLSAVRTPATSKAGKPYSYVELAYKGSDGKVQGKKVMPFGEGKPAYEVLVNAINGELYDISMVKNEASGYWDWIDAKRSTGAVATTQPSTQETRAPAGKITGSNYETVEERAKKQVYIVRQSSLSAAINLMGLQGRKTELTPKDVTEIAKEFETYVFNTEEKPTSVVALKDDLPWEDDIPL